MQATEVNIDPNEAVDAWQEEIDSVRGRLAKAKASLMRLQQSKPETAALILMGPKGELEWLRLRDQIRDVEWEIDLCESGLPRLEEIRQEVEMKMRQGNGEAGTAIPAQRKG